MVIALGLYATSGREGVATLNLTSDASVGGYRLQAVLIVAAIFMVAYSFEFISPMSLAKPANAEFVDAMSSPSAQLAWNNIIRAESAGADVSSLLSRFQRAVELVRQAEESNFTTCGSYSQCIDSANEVFISVASDAVLAEAKAKESGDQDTTAVAIGAILVGMVIAFLSLYIYKKREAYKLEKFYKLEIHLKDE